MLPWGLKSSQHVCNGKFVLSGGGRKRSERDLMSDVPPRQVGSQDTGSV